MKASVVTIGDEILIGQIIDTNTASIARKLNSVGITVVEKLSIADSARAIIDTIKRLEATNDIIILTGGLGPTKDDITKYTLTKYFNSELIYNDAEGEHIRQLLARRGIAFTDLNRGQAMLPACCTPLHNAHGTAPGMWFETSNRCIIVSLPGVPFEMEHLMDDIVIPRFKERFQLQANIHRTIITRGIPESILAERISAWEDALPEYLHLAYLPAPNVVRLRLSAYDVEDGKAEREIERQFKILTAIIGDNVVGMEGATVEQLIHNILTERGLTLAVAESCTGGTIAAKFTAMAGASAYFMAGVVSYSNEAKHDILGISNDSLTSYGAVSEAVAKEMAKGVRKVANADYAIATTGIAGPTGGTEEKPVGTVWMAVATPKGTRAVLRNCGTDRSQIISRASAYAIEMLYEELKKI